MCSALIPQFRALCAGCFSVVPWKMRADFLHAYQRRIRDRAGYEESLAVLLAWARNYDSRENGAKDVEPYSE